MRSDSYLTRAQLPGLTEPITIVLKESFFLVGRRGAVLRGDDGL